VIRDAAGTFYGATPAGGAWEAGNLYGATYQGGEWNHLLANV
jgi:hypothetical protein